MSDHNQNSKLALQEMGTSWGIKYRLLSLGLLPPIIVALTLGFYFTHLRFEDLDHALLKEGLSAAEKLSSTGELDVFDGNLNNLKLLGKDVMQSNDVESISFYNKAGHPIVSLGKQTDPLFIPDPATEVPTQVIKESKKTLTITMPVMLRQAVSNDSIDTITEEQTYRQEAMIGWVQVICDKKATHLKKYETVLSSLAIVFLGLLMSVLLCFRITKRFFEPITIMSKAIEKIRDGNLKTRANSKAQWELKTLEAGINAMADSLEHAHEELQNNIEQATSDLRHTLETIEIQNIELESAKKEALTSSKLKSEFLANMSHELRTPLNGVLGFIQLLQRTPLSSRQKDYLSTIEKSATSLLSIINDVLDLSKIEAGKLKLYEKQMNLRECLEDALILLAPSAHEKALELTLLIYQDVPTHLLSDPLRIKQLVTNLVSNSIKFTEKGSVVVRVMLEEETPQDITLCLCVTDTGIGLSKQQQKELFHAFNQIDNQIAQTVHGTGLGLVICKKIIEHMNGTISLKSELGKGSSFWFTFKVKHVLATELLEKPLANFNTSNILLMEKHRSTQISLRNALKEWNLNVTIVEEIEAILPTFEKANQTGRPFDLILIGMSPTGMDETLLQDTFTQIRHNQWCPVGVLLNTTDVNHHHQMLEQGAHFCLSKPVQHKKLHHALSQVFCEESISQNPVMPENNHESTSEPNILAVDDNSANLKLLTALFQDAGIDISTVNSGRKAIELMKYKQFDLILMDLQMPGLNGIETTKIIRSLEKTTQRRTPIVALTAHALLAEKEQLTKAGMDDFLTKPLEEKVLKSVVKRWTQGREQKNASQYAHIKKEIFVDLLHTLPKEKQAINRAFQQKQFKKLRETVHRLHGACCYCDVPDLRKALANLESSIAEQEPKEIAYYLHEANQYMEELLITDPYTQLH